VANVYYLVQRVAVYSVCVYLPDPGVGPINRAFLPFETPAYFVALDFDGDRVVSIHDFLFARYAMDGVDLSPLNPAPRSQG
jgi:hypothetical protein